MGRWSSWSERDVRLEVAVATADGRNPLEALRDRHHREWAGDH